MTSKTLVPEKGQFDETATEVTEISKSLLILAKERKPFHVAARRSHHLYGC